MWMSCRIMNMNMYYIEISQEWVMTNTMILSSGDLIAVNFGQWLIND